MKSNTDFKSEFILREAVRSDWAPAVKMVWNVFMQNEGLVYPEEGVKTFFEFLSSDRLHEMFLCGEYKMLLAEDGGKVVGVITLRDENLLSLLFVRDEYRRKGIGSALVRRLCRELQNCGVKELNVKAAPGATGFYEKCGFFICGEPREVRGILTTEMKKTW